MRLIDADNAIIALEILADKCADNRAFEQAVGVFKDVPTVDAEPVKHGQWVFTPTTGRYRCSACGEADKIIPWGRPPFAYCPHCGAKMDEVAWND